MRLFRIAREINKYHKFYEQQNGITNFSLSPISAKHESYVTISHMVECEKVNYLPHNEKCSFVLDTESCHEHTAIFDYMNFMFCTVDSSHSYAYRGALLLLIIILIYLFTILGSTADKFFCPALAVLSKAMGLSENLAGVTLLAFGNGSPDIITAVVDYEGDTEMMYAELLGAASFITTIIAGSIILIKPFKLNGSNFARDILFFIFSCFYILWFMGDQKVELLEASGTIIIYLIYLIVVIVQHIIYKRKANKAKEQYNSDPTNDLQKTLHKLNKETDFVLKDRDNNTIDANGRRNSQLSGPSRNYKLFEKFLDSVNPIDRDDWEEAGYIGKVFQILKAPAIFILNLIIPVVDYTVDTNGWCKLLNMLHCFTLPLFGLLVTGSITIKFGEIPIWWASLVLSAIFALVLLFTTRTDTAPPYHLLFAILAFIGSILVIFVVANEVVSVLGTLGFITQLSHSMLGISVFAWGNSIGDLIANIALARQGYSKMGFAACYGGPMFNTLLGMGITFLLKCFNNEERIAFARDGAMGNNCIFFLISILLFSLISAVLTNFYARRSIGVIMYGLYFVFLFFCILCEIELIHPYGTDHVNEGDFVQ